MLHIVFRMGGQEKNKNLDTSGVLFTGSYGIYYFEMNLKKFEFNLSLRLRKVTLVKVNFAIVTNYFNY